VLIVNGPGTCVVLVLVSWIRRILGLDHTRIIYVESFARVKSLSLSGKLVKPFVDTFVVQWPQAGMGGRNVEHKGYLV
jgi:beta-1,4-N-acetylglucosaminyltransferase